jgi:nucleoside-diphosphate kinase
MLKPTKEQFMKHYEEHRHTIFFNDLINFMLSGSVIAMIMEGDIQTARVIVGNTIPGQAEPGSIRGDLASSIRYNLVHCSDKVESADKEVEMWSKFIM